MPSIQYGSILQMFCADISESYSMEIPLQVLPLLAADFDVYITSVNTFAIPCGYNILYIIANGKSWIRLVYEIRKKIYTLYLLYNNKYKP